jgi:Zn-dependent protease
MRDILTWNLQLGRWAGVPVRLHVFLLITAALIWHAAVIDQPHWPGWFAACLACILLASVLVHEAAHLQIARRLAADLDEIVAWPLGNLAMPHTHEPRSELLCAAAGPLSNLLICSLILPLLVYLKWDVWPLLNPLAVPTAGVPADIARGGGHLAALVFWVNWSLAVVNLLPAFPLDGGRMLAASLSLGLGQRAATLGAARVGQVTAIWLWVIAWMLPLEVSRMAAVPLVLLGTVLFFASRQELHRAESPVKEDSSFGYDFSQGYTSLEKSSPASAADPEPGPVQRWLEERREARAQRQRQIEADEERCVDDILARLHETGLENLSTEDRALLDRVSARYRNRQSQ